MDRLLSVTMKDFAVRAFIADMSETIDRMSVIHDTTPSASAAAGRVLVATALMGATLKEETDLVNSVLRSEGEIGRIIAVSDSSCRVKCEIANPYTAVAFNDKRKIDVKSVVGLGTLTVIKDMGLKMPYIGTIELISGEIAEDYAYYFAKSEQIPSVVSLGVFVKTDLRVEAAGGFLVQLMPGCDESAIPYFEKKASELPSMTKMLMGGMALEDIQAALFSELGESHVTSTAYPEYRCNCCREKISKAIVSLGRKELEDILEEGQATEAVCHFCNTKYNFSVDEIRALLKEAL